jgi:histidine triad (HIT) family protein
MAREKLYEDAICFVTLAEKPATVGHIKVYPQKPVKTLEELDDEFVQHMFFVASYSATALFEGLKAEGTNIIVNNGSSAGQKEDSICIDVIARFGDDKLDILWKPKKLDEAKMEEAFKAIKGEAFYVNKDTKKSEKPKLSDEPPKKREKITEDNYLVKHLDKVP